MYTQKTASFPHQAEALARISDKPHFALFMEQGTGKTKVAIDHAGRLFDEGKISGMLILAPKGVHRQWIDSQFAAHCGAEYRAQIWPNILRKRRSDDWNKLDVLAMNIDSVKTKAGAELAQAFVERQHNGRVLMIVDESHQIKNKSTARWKAAFALGIRCSHRLILTGTPIAQNLMDEWAQFYWLDYKIINIRYMTAFRNEYCIMGGFEGRQIVGTRNLDRFKRLVAPYHYRITKDQLGILPKTYSRWVFDQTPEQIIMIRGLKKTLLAKMESGLQMTAANVAVAMIRIQQISSGFFVDDERNETAPLFERPEDNPRMRALMEYAEATTGPIVVWCRFVAEIKMIAKHFGDQAVAYYGGTSTKDRSLVIEEFLGGSSRFFVSNPAAGGTGLNLQGACRNAVYFSHSDSLIDRLQSEDRIHRIGTTGTTVFTDLIAQKSFDDRIRKNVASKRTFSDMAMSELKEILTDDQDE